VASEEVGEAQSTKATILLWLPCVYAGAFSETGFRILLGRLLVLGEMLLGVVACRKFGLEGLGVDGTIESPRLCCG
jgi:hypothetical protein